MRCGEFTPPKPTCHLPLTYSPSLPPLLIVSDSDDEGLESSLTVLLASGSSISAQHTRSAFAPSPPSAAMPNSLPPQYSAVITSSSQHNSRPLQDPHVAFHDSSSLYTLATMPVSPRSASPVSMRTTNSDRSPLLADAEAGSTSYGATPSHQSSGSSRRILINAGLKMAVLFMLSTIVLGGTLWMALPTLEEYVSPSVYVSGQFTDSHNKGKIDICSEYLDHLLNFKT